jgi:alkanesulfonate monooxygenase SsuD/methylene tetrahydromethanopterin reductase-like flavin-dependent oxidoreductase (luciferase family)
VEVFGFSLVGARPGVDHASSIAMTTDLLLLADEVGLDGWFVAEHHGQPGLSLSSAPLVLLAAVSQRTTRLRLGVMASIVPFQHPLRLAEELRTLDVLSGGRVEIGVGRGHLRDEQAMFGVPREAASALFDEGIDALIELLAGKDVDFTGPGWTGTGARAVPDGVQAHIPLWLTAVSVSSVDKAARLGMSCATALLPSAVADERMAAYRVAWARHRPTAPPGRFAVTAPVVVTDSTDAARATMAAEIARRQAHFARAVSDAPAGPDPTYEDHAATFERFVHADFESMIDDGLLIAGTAQECRQQVRRLRDRGIDTLIAVFEAAGTGADVARQSLARFAEEVLPAV